MNRIIIMFLLIHMAILANAQRNRDPGYSIHNYKHPNKAAEAKANGYDDLQQFDYKEVKETVHRNYKAQNQPQTQEGGIVPQQPVEKSKNSVFSNRNYKRQF